jgi:hypothetical protein
VKAATKALETGNVNYILIWVPESSEAELRSAFDRTVSVRRHGGSARGLADDWFFETAIRLHRAGEGAPYTGLKPAGLSEGPVVPKAEKAIGSGNPDETIGFIVKAVEDDLRARFHRVMETKTYDADNVAAGRNFIAAYINWVVYAHHLYMNVKGGGGNEGGEPHGEHSAAGHHG